MENNQPKSKKLQFLWKASFVTDVTSETDQRHKSKRSFQKENFWCWTFTQKILAEMSVDSQIDRTVWVLTIKQKTPEISVKSQMEQ